MIFVECKDRSALSEECVPTVITKYCRHTVLWYSHGTVHHQPGVQYVVLVLLLLRNNERFHVVPYARSYGISEIFYGFLFVSRGANVVD